MSAALTVGCGALLATLLLFGLTVGAWAGRAGPASQPTELRFPDAGGDR